MNGRTNTTGQVLMGLFIPLEPISDLNLVPRDSKCLIQWTDPVDKYTTPGNELVAQWQYTIVVRKENSAPTGPTDGVLVVKEITRNQYAEIAYEDTGLNNGTTYYYALYAYTIMNVVNEAAIDDVLVREFQPVYVQTIANEYSGTLTNTTNHMLFGGGSISNGNYVNTVITYDHQLTKGSATGIHRAVTGAGAGSLQGHAFFVEGSYGRQNYSTGISIYDPDLTRISSSAPSSYDARSGPRLCPSANIMYFAGGRFRDLGNYGNSTIECVDLEGTSSDIGNVSSRPIAATNGKHAIYTEREMQSAYSPHDICYAYNDEKVLQDISNVSIQRKDGYGLYLNDRAVFGGGLRTFPYLGSPTTISDALDVYTFDQMLTRQIIGQFPIGLYNITGVTIGKFIIFAGGESIPSIAQDPMNGSSNYIYCWDDLFTYRSIDMLPESVIIGGGASSGSIGDVGMMNNGAILNDSDYYSGSYGVVFRLS